MLFLVAGLLAVWAADEAAAGPSATPPRKAFRPACRSARAGAARPAARPRRSRAHRDGGGHGVAARRARFPPAVRSALLPFLAGDMDASVPFRPGIFRLRETTN